MRKTVIKLLYLCIYSKLIFWSTISRDHLQSKVIYISYSKIKSIKTVRNFYDVAR